MSSVRKLILERFQKKEISFEEFLYRRTGRSTKQALTYILNCLNCPGIEFQVEDHSKNKYLTEVLCRQIKATVKTLGISTFEVNQCKKTIIFNEP